MIEILSWKQLCVVVNRGNVHIHNHMKRPWGRKEIITTVDLIDISFQNSQRRGEEKKKR